VGGVMRKAVQHSIHQKRKRKEKEIQGWDATHAGTAFPAQPQNTTHKF
jgi:hypothetical protein